MIQEIDVVTVTYNSNGHVQKFLRSLSEMAEEIGLLVNLYLVDNASTDGTQSAVHAAFWQTKGDNVVCHFVYNHRNKGLSKAINQALKMCRSDHVLFCNPDVIFTDIRPMLDFVERNPWIGVAPRFVSMDGAPIKGTVHRRFATIPRIFMTYSNLGRFLGRVFPQITRDYIFLAKDAGPVRVEQPGGSFLLLSRRAIKRLSDGEMFYEEKLPVFWNDVDMAIKGMTRGIRFAVIPSVVIPHYSGHSVMKISEERRMMLFWSNVGLMGFRRKWGMSTRAIPIWYFLDAIFFVAMRGPALLVGRKSRFKRSEFFFDLKYGMMRFRCTLM